MSKCIDVLNHWLNRSSESSHSFTVSEDMRGTREAFSDRPLFSHEPFIKEKQIYVKCGVLDHQKIFFFLVSRDCQDFSKLRLSPLSFVNISRRTGGSNQR
ncbi:predicted protein [Botrytis cinerea T4]|uniref:Uncharacterized protein n=1 Tax=Botryotinia fuckeliana (strain T4) TaxID=999810 RepID=G2YQD0_BOTF4|nr:predicted protein [Botrytis cinerea T4]